MHSYYDYYQVCTLYPSRSLSGHVKTEEGNSNFKLYLLLFLCMSQLSILLIFYNNVTTPLEFKTKPWYIYSLPYIIEAICCISGKADKWKIHEE